MTYPAAPCCWSTPPPATIPTETPPTGGSPFTAFIVLTILGAILLTVGVRGWRAWRRNHPPEPYVTAGAREVLTADEIHTFEAIARREARDLRRAEKVIIAQHEKGTW